MTSSEREPERRDAGAVLVCPHCGAITGDMKDQAEHMAEEHFDIVLDGLRNGPLGYHRSEISAADLKRATPITFQERTPLEPFDPDSTPRRVDDYPMADEFAGSEAHVPERLAERLAKIETLLTGALHPLDSAYAIGAALAEVRALLQEARDG